MIDERWESGHWIDWKPIGFPEADKLRRGCLMRQPTEPPRLQTVLTRTGPYWADRPIGRAGLIRICRLSDGRYVIKYLADIFPIVS